MIWLDAFMRIFEMRRVELGSARFAAMDATDELDERLAAAGRAAIAEAEHLWRMDVYDPKASDKTPHGQRSRDVITRILMDAGWGWAAPYKGDGHVAWCGLFAATCWRVAGIDPSMLATFWASTIRLHCWAHYKPFNGKSNAKPADGPYRLATKITRTTRELPFAPRAGDILIIGDGKPAEGDHICLVASYDPETRVFRTIEGNGMGMGPTGKRREGIVKAERPIDGIGYSAMWLYRPAPSDIEVG